MDTGYPALKASIPTTWATHAAMIGGTLMTHHTNMYFSWRWNYFLCNRYLPKKLLQCFKLNFWERIDFIRRFFRGCNHISMTLINTRFGFLVSMLAVNLPTSLTKMFSLFAVLTPWSTPLQRLTVLRGSVSEHCKTFWVWSCIRHHQFLSAFLLSNFWKSFTNGRKGFDTHDSPSDLIRVLI